MTYLDTHVVAWLYAGQTQRISAKAQRRIERSELLLISPMVVLELQYLFEVGRTRKPAAPVVAVLSERIGLEVCDRAFGEVTAAAARESWTRDPFDRVLVGQAKLAKAALVSKDDSIREHYARAVW